MNIINTNHIENVQYQEERESSRFSFCKEIKYRDTFINFLRGRIGKTRHPVCITDNPSRPWMDWACTYLFFNENTPLDTREIFLRDGVVYAQAYVSVRMTSGKEHVRFFPPGTQRQELEEFVKKLQVPDKQIEI